MDIIANGSNHLPSKFNANTAALKEPYDMNLQQASLFAPSSPESITLADLTNLLNQLTVSNPPKPVISSDEIKKTCAALQLSYYEIAAVCRDLETCAPLKPLKVGTRFICAVQIYFHMVYIVEFCKGVKPKGSPTVEDLAATLTKDYSLSNGAAVTAEKIATVSEWCEENRDGAGGALSRIIDTITEDEKEVQEEAWREWEAIRNG